MTIQMQNQCKNLCKQQPQKRQHQLHLYNNKIEQKRQQQQQQQSNTTFGGKLIDFGAIQWLWKVLQRIINYMELDSTRTHFNRNDTKHFRKKSTRTK